MEPDQPARSWERGKKQPRKKNGASFGSFSDVFVTSTTWFCEEVNLEQKENNSCVRQ